MNEYTIPKPTLSRWTKVLFGVVILALAGLGIVAYETFGLFHGPLVASIFGLVIELGAATDAAGLAQGLNKKTWWILPAIAITLVVSGWYNYTVVERAGLLLVPPITNGWILHAVAWGPLASTFFMAIGLGIQIDELEGRIHQWELDQQERQDDQADIEKQVQERQVEAERLERENTQKLQAQLEAQQERDRLASQERIRTAELEVEERDKKRAFRLESRRLAQEVPGVGGRSSIEGSKGTYRDYKELLASNGTHEYTNRELSVKLKVTTRTITEWRAKHHAELENVSIETVTNG